MREPPHDVRRSPSADDDHRPTPETILAPAARPEAGPSWRLLVVEDDPAMARMIAAAMVSEGAEVRTAADGWAALEILRSWVPDVIVLDLGLPHLDGPGFAAAYRQRRGFAPIVVVSGAQDASATSDRIGARAWLSKPFELDQLIELVRPPEDGRDVTRA